MQQWDEVLASDQQGLGGHTGSNTVDVAPVLNDMISISHLYLPWQLVKHVGELLGFILLLVLRHLLDGVWHRLFYVTGDGVDAGTSRRTRLLRHCDMSSKCTNVMHTWGAPTRVLQICIPPCPSPRLQSTESLLVHLPGVLGPPGVPRRFRTRCISTGCRLHDDIIKRQQLKQRVNRRARGAKPRELSPAHRFLYTGRRGTLQPSVSRPCRHASSDGPACFSGWSPPLAWSSRPSVVEVPAGADSSTDARLLPSGSSFHVGASFSG